MFLIGQGVRGIRPVVNAEMTTGLHSGWLIIRVIREFRGHIPNVQRLLGQAVFSGEAFFFLKEDFFSCEKEAIEDGAGRCRQLAGKA